MLKYPMKKLPKIAFLGFGEAASAFAKGWEIFGLTISAFDIKTNSDATRIAMLDKYTLAKVYGHNIVEDAVKDADVILSFVTADQAHTAAKSVLGFCKPGAMFFDCNSCSPDTKRASARLIENEGGRYVDVAVMAPVHPALNKTHLHISGPHNASALELMKSLEMNVDPLEGDVGTASAVKMMRSIMVKGIEATLMECTLAARKAGVDELVFDSLDVTYPGFDLKKRAAFIMERMMVHGVRRAAEMREVAVTVDQLDLDNSMASATVEWQQKIGDLQLDPDYNLSDNDYGPRADIILAALDETQREQ